VLYASCAACRGITSLYCSGAFMPHVPMEVVPTRMGAACPNCGVIPQVFTCSFCWTAQYLFLPGGPAPSPAFGGSGQNYAAVVQAPAGASTNAVMDLVKEFVGGAGQAAGNAVFGQ
jgi:hypothetical protein